MPATTIDFYEDPPTKLVVAKGEDITVVFDYPLEHKTKRTYSGPLDVEDLKERLMMSYAEIYDEEARNGVYGIWGHALNDLSITGLGVCEDGLYYMAVDS